MTFTDSTYVVKERRLTFGRQYRIFDGQGQLVAYVKQKMFKLKEDIVFFADETQTTEVLRLKATKILDFNANLEIIDPNDGVIGALRRKGWRSMLRDQWEAHNNSGRIGVMSEDSWLAALFRRFGPFGALFPHRYETRADEDKGESLVSIKERFQLFGDTYDVTIHDFDARVALALTVLADALEAE